MEPIVLLVGVALVVGIAAMAAHAKRSETAWRNAARALELPYSPATMFRFRKMEGRIRGIPVTVDEFSQGSGKNSTTYTRAVVGPSGIPASLALKAQGSLASVAKLLGAEDVEVGDPDFDRQVTVRGSASWWLAALRSDARERLLMLVQKHGCRLEKGNLICETPGTVTEPRILVERVREMMALVEQLSVRNAEITDGLLCSVREDPHAGVRLRALRLLLQECPRTRCSDQAVQHALQDEDVRLRFLAATHDTSSEAMEVLKELMRNPALERDLRLQAFDRILHTLSYWKAGDVVASALRSDDEALQCAAVRAIGRVRDVSQLKVLLSLSTTLREALRASVAEALGAIGDSRAEPALLQLLESESESAEVRLAAAKALSTVGSVLAVEPLLPLTKGLLTDRRLKEAALGAIRSIQARLGNVESGRLTLVEPAQEAGALSLTQPEGAVSLVKPGSKDGT